MTQRPTDSARRTYTSLLREPLLHFLLLGLGLFLAQRLVHKDPRELIVTSSIKVDLARRFEDTQGHPPSADELAQEVQKWSRDEALYREALRRGLDQDDASVRSVLIDKMQVLASAEVRDPVPSEANLDAWWAAHQRRYELPVRYDFEFFTVDLAEQGKSQILRLEQELAAGQQPHQLGQVLHGAHLDVSAMKGRVAKELAAVIPQLSVGPWHRVSGVGTSWLVRVKRTTGGVPDKSQVREQLIADWVADQRQKRTDAILQQTVDLYRVEERR